MKFYHNNIRIRSLLIKASFFFVIISFSPYLSFSQLKEVNIDKLNEIKYTEELFVQTDRDIYIAGENVFMKIYKLNGLTRTPGNISQVVYVNLIDMYNNPVTELKIGINGFSGSGILIIPDTLRTGNYLICSYTRWMHNFSVDMFSYKRISVINPFENINKIRIPAPGNLPDSVAFYPESGKIIAGVENIIGCRCFCKNGNPSGISGVVSDSDSDTLCRVHIDNNGSGFFSIKPSGTDPVYLVTGEGRNLRRFALPSAEDSGICFSVKRGHDQNIFKITIRGNSNFIDGSERTYLVYSPVSARLSRREIELVNDTEIFLQKDTLPVGLAKIMLINEAGFILAKRWVYNDKKQNINVSIKLDDTVYSTRNKVKTGITVKDTDGNPVVSDLLISVVRSFSVDKANSGTLSGYAQLPFLATIYTDFERFDINDYLIFYSNGNKFLKADESVTEEDSLFIPELGGHLVSGKIINTKTGEPLRKEYVTLSFVGKNALCKFSRTDDYGSFNFVVGEHGTREVVIQPMSPGLEDYYVELDYPFSGVFNICGHLPYYPDASKLSEINNAIISMQVKKNYDPYLESNKSGPEMRDETDFYGEPVNTVLISRYIELNSLKEIVKEIVPGVSINRESGLNKFVMILDNNYQICQTNPLVLVDGIPVHDPDKVLNIDPKELEKIEILKERYLISDIVMEGIVHFITRKGDLSAVEFGGSVFRQEFESLQPEYRFNFPDYSADSLKNGRIPDFRNTLYWDPDLSTNSTGEAIVEFYTSDESGEYTVVVQGITSDGKTGKAEISFHVKDN